MRKYAAKLMGLRELLRMQHALPMCLSRNHVSINLLLRRTQHDNIQGGPKKPHKVNDTIILQPYVIESRGF